jgi:hypothetical protein
MEQREKERLLWVLRSAPNEIADLIGDLPPDVFNWRPVPQKWSLVEVMCHLRDLEAEVYQERYRRYLTEDNPYFPRLDQDAMAAERDYISQDIRSALASFRQRRQDTVRILEETPPEQWSRGGVHFSAGPMTLEQMVARQSDHDIKHLIQMKDIARLKMPW